jgi:hypothetical protein
MLQGNGFRKLAENHPVMRSFISALFMLACLSMNAQDVKPEIRGMWTNNNQKKPKVYTISNGEVVCNSSDVNNRYASSVKNFKTIEITSADGKNGRIIAQHDSENVIRYYAFDYFNLNTDSVKVAAIKSRFDNAEAAKACAKTKPETGETFYTNEYMGRLARIKRTPELTKEGYLSFLRDVSKEIQKPEVKNMKIEAGKNPDIVAREFMMKMVTKKQYQDKIIPETLEIAMNKFKDDANVKKVWPTIRVWFMPRPGAPTPAAPAKTSTPATPATPAKKK